MFCLASNLYFSARRLRKAFGGGIRQGGILAAAAIYALDDIVPRIHKDHEHANILSKGKIIDK